MGKRKKAASTKKKRHKKKKESQVLTQPDCLDKTLCVTNKAITGADSAADLAGRGYCPEQMKHAEQQDKSLGVTAAKTVLLHCSSAK